jgi:hypothetical protein
MQAETGERWRALCEEAAVEQDAKKLIQLIREINELLEAKERRLKQQRAPGTVHEASGAITH